MSPSCENWNGAEMSLYTNKYRLFLSHKNKAPYEYDLTVNEAIKNEFIQNKNCSFKSNASFNGYSMVKHKIYFLAEI